MKGFLAERFSIFELRGKLREASKARRDDSNCMNLLADHGIFPWNLGRQGPLGPLYREAANLKPTVPQLFVDNNK